MMSYCIQSHLHKCSRLLLNIQIKAQLIENVKNLVNSHSKTHWSFHLNSQYIAELNQKIHSLYVCSSNRHLLHPARRMKLRNFNAVRFYARGSRLIPQNKDYSDGGNLNRVRSLGGVDAQDYADQDTNYVSKIHSGTMRHEIDSSDIGVSVEGDVMAHSDRAVPSELIGPPKAADLSLPELSRFSVNVAAYVNRSQTLQKMVLLGVDLSKVQQVGIISKIPKLKM